MRVTGLSVAAACAVAVSTLPALSAQNPTLFERVKEGPVVESGGRSRGVAWGDFDGDGRDDLFVANTTDQRSFLYRNTPSGLVPVVDSDVTKAGSNAEGGTWVDFDNDGDVDLYVSTFQNTHNLLFRNDAGRLVQVVDHPLVADRTSATASCWADFDGDLDLDVFIATRDGQDDVLFTNEGGGSFTKITTGAAVTSGGDGRACGWSDIDRDGDPDLYVANADQPAFLFRNDKGVLERDQASDAVQPSTYRYGMSWADADEDGDFDLFVSTVLQGNTLYRNDNGMLTASTPKAIADIVAPSKGNTWGDWDNDGDLDLLVANGTNHPDNRNLLFMNDGAWNFRRNLDGDLGADNHTSAGAAASDFDGDGDLDVMVANWVGARLDDDLYLNRTSGRQWLELDLRGTKSNRFGVGAIVRATAVIGGVQRTLTREVSTNTGYGSQNSFTVHFGLGDATEADLEIRWPSGLVERHAAVRANRRLAVPEGAVGAMLSTTVRREAPLPSGRR